MTNPEKEGGWDLISEKLEDLGKFKEIQEKDIFVKLSWET